MILDRRMAELTLEMLRAELAPIHSRLGAMGAPLDGVDARLDAIGTEIAAMRPNVDGIWLIQRAVNVLQNDVRMLRDDMTVVSATTMRLDRTRDHHEGVLTDILREMRAVHAQIAGIASRVRRLEGVDEP
jgi:hypothetical protein